LNKELVIYVSIAKNLFGNWPCFKENFVDVNFGGKPSNSTLGGKKSLKWKYI
jgi:hypothetical protein